MVTVTADHHIQNHDAFIDALKAASAIADDGYLVTLGVTPTFHPRLWLRPLWREFGQRGWFQSVRGRCVHREAGPGGGGAVRGLCTYAWNSGMFVWRTERILVRSRLMPDLHATLTRLDEVWGRR